MQFIVCVFICLSFYLSFFVLSELVGLFLYRCRSIVFSFPQYVPIIGYSVISIFKMIWQCTNKRLTKVKYSFEVNVQLQEGVNLMWAFETAGFHCSVLTQPTTVLAFRTQRERQRGGESERPSSGESRSRRGSRMSQTGTQRFLRLNKRQRVSQHSSSDAKTFTEPRMPSSPGPQWQLCHLLVFLKSIHIAGAFRERDFYR